MWLSQGVPRLWPEWLWMQLPSHTPCARPAAHMPPHLSPSWSHVTSSLSSAGRAGADTGSTTYSRAVDKGLSCFIYNMDITTVPSHCLCSLALGCAPRAFRPRTQPAVWVRPPGRWACTCLGSMDLLHLQACLKHLPSPTWGAGKLLTRMLGSLSECLARATASSVTLVSPLAWISSTAIWRQGQEVRHQGVTAQGGGAGSCEEARPGGHGASTSNAHIPKEKMSTAVRSATSERGTEGQHRT